MRSTSTKRFTALVGVDRLRSSRQRRLATGPQAALPGLELVSSCKESFDLEPVVEVGIATAQGRRKTGCEVGRHEQGPPKFTLPHVYALVRARRLQRPTVPSYHNMPERQGSASARHEREMRQQPG
jgi:hypothetical protein